MHILNVLSRRAGFIVLGSIAFLIPNARADCVDYGSFARQVGLYPYSDLLDVKVAGTNAYLALQPGPSGYIRGNGLKILDVSDPASLKLVSYIDLPAPRDIALAGSNTLVADAVEDLVVIQSSSIVSKLQLPGTAKAISAWGTFAFVGSEVGIQKVNLTNPASPTIVGAFITQGPVLSLFQSDSLLYAAEKDFGIEIIDPNVMTLVGHVDTPGYANGVTVSGDYAFVADQVAGVQIIDVSDPQLPHIVGSHDPVIDYTYYDNAYDLTVVGNLLVIGHADGLRILDISNPVAPLPICRIRSLVSAPYGDAPTYVFANSSFAYLGGKGGLYIFDIHNPYSAPILGQSDAPFFAGAVAVSGTHAYVADHDFGFWIFDVSNPNLPTTTGWYGPNLGNTVDIAVEDDHAYIANLTRGLMIFDVSDPTNPVLLGETPTQAERVVVDSGFAYVTGSGLQIFDVSNPASPNLVGQVTGSDLVNENVGPASIREVAVRDGQAYLTVQDGYLNQTQHMYGFYVIDVSNPASPVVVGSRRDLPYTSSVALSGHYAYVTNDGFSSALHRQVTDLMVIDVSNPFSPVLVGAVPSGGGRLSVDGEVAYVSSSQDGVGVFDVSNPQLPSFIGRVSPDYATSDVEAGSGFVYAAQGPLGLVVLPTQCPFFVPVSLASLEAVSSPDGILLTWEPRDAFDQLGFNVYRARVLSGPYERLTAEPQNSSRYLDVSAPVGRTVFYKLEVVDRAGRSTFFGPVSALRETANLRTGLGLCRPNPFGGPHAFTDLEFTIAHSGPVRIRVLDAAGRQVRLVSDGNLDAGSHTSRWDGRNDRGEPVAPGVYFYRLDTEGFSGSRTLLRVP